MSTFSVGTELRRQASRPRTRIALACMIALPLIILAAFEFDNGGGDDDGNGGGAFASLVDVATAGGPNFALFTLLMSASFLLVVVFATMVTERFRVDVVAMVGVSLLLVTGILSTKEVLAVFSNEAPITVAASTARTLEGCVPCARSATAGAAAFTAAVVAVAGAISGYFFARWTARWSCSLLMLERPSIFSRLACA